MDVPRSAGVLLPLFSVRTARGWGLGELPDLASLAPWAQHAGLRVIMMLPLLEVALGQASPYSALSAFALDPVFVALDQVEDFGALGGEPALPPEDRAALEAVRGSDRIDWSAVRGLKDRWLRRAHATFLASGAAKDTERARDLADFREQERDWLPDYALFRALKEELPSGSWRAWPGPLRSRSPAALAKARARLAPKMAYFEYAQWLAHRQLERARQEARRFQVLFAGDLPFMVALDSADAWARQAELRFDATIGAPPDEYSAEGQDWGLPVYRWDIIADRAFDWLRHRGERAVAAYDIVRVDHVVGFYRTFVRPRDGSEFHFSPEGQRAQTRQGEAVMSALRSGGGFIVAEDLGTVPRFVRASLTRLGIPGFRVLRWERDEDGVFGNPLEWPDLSVAASGTHDTDPLAVWWEGLDDEDRARVCAIPALASCREIRAFLPSVHRALLNVLYRSGSRLLLLPVQDLFGLRDRVNVPGTVSPENWTFRLPWTVPQLSSDPSLRSHAALLRGFAVESGRG